jgi:hypothetical protein
MGRKDIFNPDKTLKSNLWIDQDDAHAQLIQREKSGTISSEEAKNLKIFIDQGYFIIDLDISDTILTNIETTVQIVWSFRPNDLLVATPGQRPQPFANLELEFVDSPGTRILDFHSHCEGAKQLFLNQVLHRYCSIIYDQKPIATQSLYFNYGSTQSLHRDPWYVVTTPPSNLLAAWIALEDVDVDSGPLKYVLGSHRLPYHEMSTGDIITHDPNATNEDRHLTYAFMDQKVQENNLQEISFLAKKGQALIWHASLIHGGSPVKNPLKTRKSFVIHYDIAKCHSSHAQKVNVSVPFIARTQKLLEQNGCIGFDNPLRVHDSYQK